MSAPGQTAGVAVFVDHMIDDLSLTRSSISGAYLAGTLLGAATLPMMGRAIDRWGVRYATLAIALAFGVALGGMASVAGFGTLLLGFTGIRMLGQGALPPGMFHRGHPLVRSSSQRGAGRPHRRR